MVRSIKHMNSGVSFFFASSCSRRTTNIMSTVERWGLNPRCSSSRMPSRSQYVVTEAARDDFEEHFAGVRHEGDATIVATLRYIFLLVWHLNSCILPLLRHGLSPPHRNKHGWLRSTALSLGLIVPANSKLVPSGVAARPAP